MERQEENRVDTALKEWQGKQPGRKGKGHVDRELEAREKIDRQFSRGTGLSKEEKQSLARNRESKARIRAQLDPGAAELFFRKYKNPVARFFAEMLKTIRENRNVLRAGEARRNGPQRRGDGNETRQKRPAQQAARGAVEKEPDKPLKQRRPLEPRDAIRQVERNMQMN